LRRGEIGTERKRPKWLEFLIGPGRLAGEYVHAAGRRVDEVMTAEPITVSEDDSLEAVVELMERRRIKRLPVLRDGKMVGIVSRPISCMRWSLLRARSKRRPATMRQFASGFLTAIGKHSWAPRVNVVVTNGVVELWGTITDEREREALKVATENVVGVRQVHGHLVWVEPMSGMAFASAEDEAKAQAEAAASNGFH
jgi:predicted transcriptional regulator